MDLRGTPQQVFARMPDTIRETMRRAWDRGHQHFEVPVYEDRLMDRPPSKAEDALKLRYYRFTLRDIFGPEGIAKLAMVDPVLALQLVGRKVSPKALFNSLPMTKQAEAVREWKHGNTAFVVQMAEGTTRPAVDGERCYPYFFPLREVFTSPKLLAEFGSALRGPELKTTERILVEATEKTVADGVDAMHLEKLQRNWPYDVPGTWLDAPEPEAPNNTPRGLLMVAPMDYRLGQWRAC